MKAEIKDEGFDINAIVEQLPKEEAKEKKDYKNNGEGLGLFLYENNLTYWDLEEVDGGMLGEEYDQVGDKLKRRGSNSLPGGEIKDNGRRFNTWHSDDSINKKYGIFERTAYQEILFRKGGGDPSKAAAWVKKHFPELYKKWEEQSLEEDFGKFKEEKEDIPEDKKRYTEIKKKYELFENPAISEKTFLGTMVRECSKLCSFTNQENFIIANLEVLYGTICASLACIPDEEKDIGDIQLNGMTSSLMNLNIGDTGDGKSDSHKIIFARLIKTFPHISGLIHTGQIGSSSGGQKIIFKSPTIVFAHDEITKLLQEAMNGNPLYVAVLDLILKYFNHVDKDVTELKEESKLPVYFPHVSISSNTVYDFYKTFIKSDFAKAGGIRRFSNTFSNGISVGKHFSQYKGKSFPGLILDEHKLLNDWIKRAKYQIDVTKDRLVKKASKGNLEYYEFLPAYSKAPISVSLEAQDFLYEKGEEYLFCGEECGNELMRIKFRTCWDLIMRRAIIYAFTERYPSEWLIPGYDILEREEKITKLEDVLLEDEESLKVATEMNMRKEKETVKQCMKTKFRELQKLKADRPSYFPSFTVELRHLEWSYGQTMQQLFTELRYQFSETEGDNITVEDRVSEKSWRLLLKNLKEVWDKRGEAKEIKIADCDAFKSNITRINKKSKVKISAEDCLNHFKNQIKFHKEKNEKNGKVQLILTAIID